MSPFLNRMGMDSESSVFGNHTSLSGKVFGRMGARSLGVHLGDILFSSLIIHIRRNPVFLLLKVPHTRIHLDLGILHFSEFGRRPTPIFKLEAKSLVTLERLTTLKAADQILVNGNIFAFCVVNRITHNSILLMTVQYSLIQHTNSSPACKN